eukprot:COSAG01_NODE_367_length_18064_cov_23.990315_2_plen_1367_part_00
MPRQQHLAIMPGSAQYAPIPDSPTAEVGGPALGGGVERADVPGGGGALQPPGQYVIEVGSSLTSSSGWIKLPGPFYDVSPVHYNPETGNFAPSKYGLKFDVDVQGNRVRVRRIDKDSGWRKELKLLATFASAPGPGGGTPNNAIAAEKQQQTEQQGEEREEGKRDSRARTSSHHRDLGGRALRTAGGDGGTDHHPYRYRNVGATASRHLMPGSAQYAPIPDSPAAEVGGPVLGGGVERAVWTDVPGGGALLPEQLGAAAAAGSQSAEADDDDNGGAPNNATVSAAAKQHRTEQHGGGEAAEGTQDSRRAWTSSAAAGISPAGGQNAVPPGGGGLVDTKVLGQLVALCGSPYLTPAALVEALEPLPAGAMATPDEDENGWTPLHRLCINSALTVELLTAGRAGVAAEAMDTPDKQYGDTPLHGLCSNKALTAELLTAGRAGVAAEAMATPSKSGVTPLHVLCAKSKLTAELLTTGRVGVAAEAMTTPDESGRTPLHMLCGNSALTAELLTAGRAGVPAEAMATPDEDGDTPLHRLCRNSEFFKKSGELARDELVSLWSVDLDPLVGLLSNNDTRLARQLLTLLPKGLPRTGDGISDDVDSVLDPSDKELHGRAPSITLPQVPGMVDNLQRMYSSGLGSVATALLREHGVAEAGYAPKGSWFGDPERCSRVELGSLGMAGAGSEELAPTFTFKKQRGKKRERWDERTGQYTQDTAEGVDWCQHLKSEQCDYYNNKRIAVKPVVLAVCGAAHAGDQGLLHVLTQPGVPVTVFDTRITKLLIAHKWQAFGRRMFLADATVFVLMLVAWQTLALLVAQHGDDAVAEVATGCAVAGALLGVAVPGMLAAARACLPLAPRAANTRRGLDANYNVWWYIWEGWEEDADDDERTQWSPLGVLAFCLFGRCLQKLPGLLGLLLGLPLWFLVVLPGYYALALAARPVPAVAAVALLGGTPSGLLGLQPASLSAVALTALLATTTRNIVQELKEANGSTGLTAGLTKLTAPYKKQGVMRVLCAAPNALVLLARGVGAVAAAIKGHLTAEIWNGLDLATLTFNILLAVRILTRCDAVITCQLAVVNTTLLWLRLVQLLSGFDSTAVYVGMFTSVFSEMLSFLLMIGIFIVSNGFALDLLYPNHLHGGTTAEEAELAGWTTSISNAAAVDKLSGTVWRALFASFDMALGEFDRGLLDDAFSPLLAYAVFIFYIVMVNIVMLNLLIALMGGSYERVAETGRLVRQRERAKLILQYERLMSEADRNNKQWHPRYLHALVPADELEEEVGPDEAGVINGVKRLLLTNAKSGGSLESKMDKKVEGIQARVGQLESKMEKKVSTVEEKVSKVDEKVAQMNTKLDEVLTALALLAPKEGARGVDDN